jgi:SAM-dependent methyltransferase
MTHTPPASAPTPHNHWETIYGTKDHKAVSWFADHVETTPEWIRELGMSKTAALVDIGGGASTWVDDMLDQGFKNLTVLDLSPSALNIAKARLGARGETVKWLAANVLDQAFAPASFDLWHDRAVFHFLTDEDDRAAYRTKVTTALKPGGSLLFSIFADDGPEKCSGLTVRRHSENELTDYFGGEFESVQSSRGVHVTPGGSEQRFVTVLLQKKD